MACFVYYDELEQGRLVRFYSESGTTDKMNVVMSAVPNIPFAPGKFKSSDYVMSNKAKQKDQFMATIASFIKEMQSHDPSVWFQVADQNGPHPMLIVALMNEGLENIEERQLRI